MPVSEVITVGTKLKIHAFKFAKLNFFALLESALSDKFTVSASTGVVFGVNAVEKEPKSQKKCDCRGYPLPRLPRSRPDC